MAPLSPDNTARFRFHYTTISKQHAVQVRSTQSPAALGILMDTYFSAWGVTVAEFVVDFVDWAPAGSDIFNPVTTGIEGNAYTGGTFTADKAAWTYSLIGRTTGGRRVRLTHFGALFLGGDYRFVAGESSPLDAVVAAVNAMGANILGIDGLAPVWKSYVNAGVNDHWLKELRP